MSVVLRCPICGTTQAHVGECEACSEGEVRYFCTNHDKGIWLDGAVCSRCAAKFGDPPRRPPERIVRSPPAPAPDFRAPERPRPPERRLEPEFGRRPPRRPEFEAPAEAEPLPTLGELLEEITAARARPRRGDEAGPPWMAPPARRPGFAVAGCLGRVVGAVLLMIIAVVIFLVLLFGGLFLD